MKSFSPWLLELDPKHSSAQKFHTKFSDQITVSLIQLQTAALVPVTNITLISWAKAKFGTHNDIGTIYLGNCSIAKGLAFWLYLLINIFSTLLLSVNRCCMQLLVAFTYHELDKTYEKSFWLNIGMPNFKNFKK